IERHACELYRIEFLLSFLTRVHRELRKLLALRDDRYTHRIGAHHAFIAGRYNECKRCRLLIKRAIMHKARCRSAHLIAGTKKRSDKKYERTHKEQKRALGRTFIDNI